MSVIPSEVAPAAMACDAFIVEDLRSARRYLRKIGFTKNFDELPFFEMTKGADQTNLSVFIKKNIELYTGHHHWWHVLQHLSFTPWCDWFADV